MDSFVSHVKRTTHQPENLSISAGIRLPPFRLCPDGKVTSVGLLLGAISFIPNDPPSATALSTEPDEHQNCYAKNTGCNPLHEPSEGTTE